MERYDLLEEIGHGGMATVYRARDSRLDRLVAMKIMHPHLRGANEARARFAREAQSVARLHHPNILEIYDNSEPESEDSYIVTELLTGPTLKVFAEKHPDMPGEIAACFVIEIARALDAAHQAGVIHRDVKPENVLLHENRGIKLTDFGIAQMVGSQSFTATGQILGSPGHMAPEQVEGADCDARTDLFSLGTVLYFLATGKLPFLGRNPHQTLKRIMDGDYLDPLRARPSIGRKLGAIIARSLERARDNRYQTAADLIRDLQAFVEEAGVTEPAKMLERYLQDPDGTTTGFHMELTARLIAHGEAAVRSGQIRVGLDYFNRVLALDDGNAKVLGLIERIGRRSALRRHALRAGVALGALGLGAIVYSAWVASDLGPPRAPPPISHGAAPSSVRSTHPDPVTRPSKAAVEPAPADGGEPSRARPARTVRVVRFNPTPRNVKIAIDGEPSQPFGPSFYFTSLRLGRHRFVVESSENCCEVLQTDRVIPSGEGDFVLDFRLRFRPASLYITSSVPADVVVNNGEARGRTSSVILVPMTQPQSTVSFTVTAPGYDRYTGTTRIRAGEPPEPTPVTLTQSGVPAAANP